MPVVIINNSDFPGLAFIELILNHSNPPLRSHLRLQNTFPRFLLRLYSVLSSTKLQTFDFVIESNKSLINILQIRGPRIEPCGTPVLMSYLLYYEVIAESILILCLHLVK